MDILAHSLWTNVLYKAIPATRNNKKTTYWGIFFGVFPDLFAFTPVFFYVLFEQMFHYGTVRLARPEDGGNSFPLSGLTHGLYSFSHSLVIWTFLFFLIWKYTKKVPWFMFGWALHISIDIFSHSNQFYPTPFLFPISKFHVNGYSWGEPVFMMVNYGALALLYLFVVPKIKKKYALG